MNLDHLGYNGNPKVKRDGVTWNYTKEELEEYIKCKNDPVYFLCNYTEVVHLDHGQVKFKLRGYQEKMVRHFSDNRMSVILSGRQSGKTLTSAGWLLWYICFHTEKTVAILANKGAIARDILYRITSMLETVPFFLQPGVKELNKGSIVFSNKSKIVAAATSSSSIRGMACNVIFLDEFAFVKDATTFYTATFPVISSGETTKVIVTSTPNGVGNMFYKIWEEAIQARSDYKPMKIDWWEVPGRDAAWKARMIANTSELQFEQEYSCSFIGAADTLISSNVLLGLKSHPAIKTHKDVRYFKEPEEGGAYVMTVDVAKGRGQDYSTFTVFNAKTTPFEQVAVYRSNNISPLFFPEIIVRTAQIYNNALVIIENNDAGHVVCNAVYHEYEYENTFVESAVKSMGVGVTMTKRVKKIGCSNLKDLLEGGKMTIHDADTISELSSFEAVKNGSSYAAAGDAHDDLVMNLVMFSWFVSTDFFQDDFMISLRELLYAERLKESEHDLVPFGFMPTSSSQTADMSVYEDMISAQKDWDAL